MSKQALHESGEPTHSSKQASQRRAMDEADLKHAEVNPLWSSLATHVVPERGMSGSGDAIPVQPKLTIGAPDDAYEQEADAVAERVMRMPASPAPAVDDEEKTLALQPKPLGGNLVQCLCADCEEETEEQQGAPAVQAKAARVNGGNGIPASVQSAVSIPGAGTPLQAAIRARVQTGLGVDLAPVRVHSDSSSQEASQSINAKAFTHKNHIYLGKGESPADLGLMAHEATHVVQQQAAGERIQRASLISQGERGIIVNPTGSPITFAELVSLVRRRFHLDGYASWQLARWLDEKHGIFRYGSPIYAREIVVPMPRMVAFFLVDWVEPFNPYAAPGSSGASYRITPQAFAKAQRIWSEVDVFVGFRRGGAIGNAGFEQIEFTPPTLPGGEASHMTQEEQDLLALRSGTAMPPGYFHIVVTGSTTEDATATGKSIRARAGDPVQAGSEGILLFAGTYSRLGYRQVAPAGSSDQELGELLAHEIGHFLFGLGHWEPMEEAEEGFEAFAKTDIMRGGGGFDPRDHLGEASRVEIDEALATGRVARPEVATSL
jgi:hypothetical protein